MVIGKSTEEGLEGSPFLKKSSIAFFESIFSKNVDQGVKIILEPEWCRCFNLFGRLLRFGNRSGFTRVYDDIVWISIRWTASSNDSLPFLELPEEPLIPILEAIVR